MVAGHPLFGEIMNLREAYESLDKANPSQWTADGLPRLDVLTKMVGKQVTRKELLDLLSAMPAKISSKTPNDEQATPQTPPDKGIPDGKRADWVASGKAKLAELQELKAGFEAEKAEIDAKIEEVTSRMDKILVKLGEITDHNPSVVIQQFLQKQNERRVAEFKAMKESAALMKKTLGK